MINIIKDKDPIFETENYDVILLGTSVYNMLTNGFQRKMRNKYPYLDEANNNTSYADMRKLGTRLNVDGTPMVSLMYICGFPRSNKTTLDYDALTKCLQTANYEFSGKNVMTTVVGSSIFDGKGDKDKIMDIINENCKDMNLTVYDYKQLKNRQEICIRCHELWNLQYKDYDEFHRLWPIRYDYVKEKYYLQ